ETPADDRCIGSTRASRPADRPIIESTIGVRQAARPAGDIRCNADLVPRPVSPAGPWLILPPWAGRSNHILGRSRPREVPQQVWYGHTGLGGGAARRGPRAWRACWGGGFARWRRGDTLGGWRMHM